MKLKSFILAVLPVIAFASCSEESKENPETPGGPDTPQEMTFTATTEQTKTILQDGLSVYWSAGDEIAVYGTAEAFKSDIQGSVAEAEFKGPNVLPMEGKYSAVYPFSAFKEWTATSVAKMAFPESQKAVLGSFEDGANLSYAQCAENEQRMLFKNLPAYIKFTVGKSSGNIKSVTVSAAERESLAGVIELNCKSGSFKVVEGKSAVTISGEGALEKGEYYIAILPGNFAKELKITVTGVEGNVVEKSIPDSREILSGYVYPFGEVSARRVIVAEFKDGVLEGDAKKESATGNEVVEGEDVFVNIAGAAVKLDVDIPADGRYRIELIYRTHGNPGDFKPNKLEITGLDGNNDQVFYNRVINFKANAAPELMNIGTYDLKAGKLRVKPSNFWGWTAFSKVIFTETDDPAEMYRLFDAGIPENGAVLGDGHMDLNLGTISYKFDIPSAGNYRIITEAISYVNAKNTAEIESVMSPIEFEVRDLKHDYEVVIGDFICESPKEITLKITANQANTGGNMSVRSIRIIPID